MTRMIDADALAEKVQWAIEHDMYDKEMDILFDIQEASTIEPSEYLKTIPTVYLLEALGVGSVDELMEEAEVMDEIESYRSLIPDQYANKLKNPCDSLLTDDKDDSKEQKSKLDLISRDDVLGYIDRLDTCGLGKGKALEYIRKYVEKTDSVSADPKLLEDGTLVVNVPNAEKVSRVLVEDGHNGGLYYHDSAERVGVWIKQFNGTKCVCSLCGYSNGRKHNDNYCPNCGAKMGE